MQNGKIRRILIKTLSSGTDCVANPIEYPGTGGVIGLWVTNAATLKPEDQIGGDKAGLFSYA
jgi:hypothetical protein